jgi:hypothetical protein
MKSILLKKRRNFQTWLKGKKDVKKNMKKDEKKEMKKEKEGGRRHEER